MVQRVTWNFVNNSHLRASSEGLWGGNKVYFQSRTSEAAEDPPGRLVREVKTQPSNYDFKAS